LSKKEGRGEGKRSIASRKACMQARGKKCQSMRDNYEPAQQAKNITGRSPPVPTKKPLSSKDNSSKGKSGRGSGLKGKKSWRRPNWGGKPTFWESFP